MTSTPYIIYALSNNRWVEIEQLSNVDKAVEKFKEYCLKQPKRYFKLVHEQPIAVYEPGK